MSKIEAGRMKLDMEPLDLSNILAESVRVVSGRAEDKHLTLDADIESTISVVADRRAVKQIFVNLLSNAVKFTPQGSVSAIFDVDQASGALILTVKDTGVGISYEKQPGLFEKFTQADNSATRRFGGTGLGLAICRELTQMMGGVISVVSAEGMGSTFTVELPLERGEAVEAATPETAAQTDDGALRLLAAEDNPTNQQVLAAVMESLGIEIDIVPDGQQAVDAWRSGAYDLILMDIQMPVMDGIDAARKIREAERVDGRRRTPIVALTANALSHQVEEYLAVGMDGHVPKPIEIAKLYEAIGRALNDAATGAVQAA
jgi:CheY-like chemotaxis protein